MSPSEALVQLGLIYCKDPGGFESAMAGPFDEFAPPEIVAKILAVLEQVNRP